MIRAWRTDGAPGTGCELPCRAGLTYIPCNFPLALRVTRVAIASDCTGIHKRRQHHARQTPADGDIVCHSAAGLLLGLACRLMKPIAGRKKIRGRKGRQRGRLGTGTGETPCARVRHACLALWLLRTLTHGMADAAMLRPEALAHALSVGSAPGAALLITSNGSLISCAGANGNEDMIASVVSNAWVTYERGASLQVCLSNPFFHRPHRFLWLQPQRALAAATAAPATTAAHRWMLRRWGRFRRW